MGIFLMQIPTFCIKLFGGLGFFCKLETVTKKNSPLAVWKILVTGGRILSLWIFSVKIVSLLWTTDKSCKKDKFSFSSVMLYHFISNPIFTFKNTSFRIVESEIVQEIINWETSIRIV